MSFTNQMLGALGTATGALAAGKHIAEQKEQKAIQKEQKAIQEQQKGIQQEQKAISSLGQLETATSQLNLKEAQQAEAEQKLAEVENKEPETNIIAESIAAAGKVDKLNALDKKYSDQMDKGQSRDDKTGKFISKDQANARYDELRDDLKAAKKAHEAIQNKLIARENMRKDIEAKKNEVKLATDVKNQAQLIFEKNKKYLPKGGNE